MLFLTACTNGVEFIINFDSNGGSEVSSITTDGSSTINLPSNPTKEGYTFVGWYIDSKLQTPYVFGTMPAEDITIYAKWMINSYTITYIIYDDFDPLNHIILNEEEGVQSICLGAMNSSLITTEGRLFVWGSNSWGQLASIN